MMRSMGKIIGIVSMFALLMPAALSSASCEKTAPLFVIRHSENGNAVHYEACLDGAEGLSSDEPVIAYWVLENGQREELISIERKRAYGVALLEKNGPERALISVVSLRDREIAVEKSGSSYRAVMVINGRKSVLAGAFLKTEKGLFGIPVVDYIELYGKTTEGDSPVRERIEKANL